MTLAAEEVRGVIEKFDREQEIYRGLLDLSRGQMEIIEQGATSEELLELLGRKQLLINELEEIERDLTPFKRGWREVRESLEADVRAAVEQRVTQIHEILVELLDLEERGRSKLQRRQEEVVVKIREIGRSRRAHQAYAGGQSGPPTRGVIDSTG